MNKNISKTKTIRPKVTQDGITVEKVTLTPTSLNLKVSSKKNIVKIIQTFNFFVIFPRFPLAFLLYTKYLQAYSPFPS